MRHEETQAQTPALSASVMGGARRPGCLAHCSDLLQCVLLGRIAEKETGLFVLRLDNVGLCLLICNDDASKCFLVFWWVSANGVVVPAPPVHDGSVAGEALAPRGGRGP